MHNPGFHIQWNTLKPVSAKIAIEHSSQKEKDAEIIMSDFDSLEIIAIDTVEQSFVDEEEPLLTQIYLHQPSKELISKKIAKAVNKLEIQKNDSQLKSMNFNKLNTVHNNAAKTNIDWELIGTIALGILILAVFGIAIFGSGTLGTIATIASILIAIGGIILLIAAVVFLCSLFWAIFFGWWI